MEFERQDRKLTIKLNGGLLGLQDRIQMQQRSVICVSGKSAM